MHGCTVRTAVSNRPCVRLRAMSSVSASLMANAPMRRKEKVWSFVASPG